MLLRAHHKNHISFFFLNVKLFFLLKIRLQSNVPQYTVGTLIRRAFDGLAKGSAYRTCFLKKWLVQKKSPTG